MSSPNRFSSIVRPCARWRPLLGLSILAVFCCSCASTLKVGSNPKGATVSVDGAVKGTAPTELQLEAREAPYAILLSKEGYADETVSISTKENRRELSVTLQELKHTETFNFTSTPAAAAVLVDGKEVGRTPLSVPVTFARADKEAKWGPIEVKFVLRDYQTEVISLAGWQSTSMAQQLEPLRDQAEVSFRYVAPDGKKLSPAVFVDGVQEKEAAEKLTFEFVRSTKSDPWSTHTLKAEIAGIYVPQTYLVERSGPTAVTLTLQPLTELEVPRNFPTIEISPTGAVLTVDASTRIGTMNTKEQGETVQGLSRITRFERYDLAPKNRAQSLNSYAITPDGQSVVMAVTAHDERGNYYANLFVKRADDESGGISRLTDSTRYLDSSPAIAPDGSNILIFQSNRSERKKTDIFRVQLVDNRFSGGIARITGDSLFNYCPSYADSNREIIYLSLESAYPLAKPQLSTVRFDGSLPTQLQITASEASHRDVDRIYFVREDETTHKAQIYSVMPDGKLETLVITDESFRGANCFTPVASFATPRRILFVSDKEKDAQGRPQNDIYLMNVDGTAIQRLTNNASDDIQPSWSPTEPDLVYFLSNRGGSYNVWRMRLPVVRN